MPYIFDPLPDLGTIFFAPSGQRYMLDELVPYVRKDGSSTILLRWRTTCAECGIPFDCLTPQRSNGFNRRCPDHVRPGVRIRRRKSGKRKAW